MCVYLYAYTIFVCCPTTIHSISFLFLSLSLSLSLSFSLFPFFLSSSLSLYSLPTNFVTYLMVLRVSHRKARGARLRSCARSYEPNATHVRTHINSKEELRVDANYFTYILCIHIDMFTHIDLSTQCQSMQA